jgi:DNA-binding CsgD family transcriptional regulator
MGGAASQHENELVLDVQRIAEPAFAVNSSHQIVAWNDAAERLLGIRAEDIIGTRCFETLEAFNGTLCADCGMCPVGALYSRRAESHCEMPVTLAGQPERQVSLTTLTARTTGGQVRIVHLLREAPIRERLLSAASNPAVSGSKRPRPLALTQRELEVLRLLGAGHSTDEIAAELSITRVTARNHVNKVLDKLGANSRLQAVVIASQLRLI